MHYLYRFYNQNLFVIHLVLNLRTLYLLMLWSNLLCFFCPFHPSLLLCDTQDSLIVLKAKEVRVGKKDSHSNYINNYINYFQLFTIYGLRQ